MVAKPQLFRKGAIRNRLIFACLAVALLVSAIYVIVSYRLSADLSIQTELKSMSRVAELLQEEMTQADRLLPLHESALDTLFGLADSEVSSVIQISSPQHTWSKSSFEDESLGVRLINATKSLSSEDQAVITIDDKSYLWFRVSNGEFTTIYIKETALLNATLQLVVKRLLITSVIVFWIAIWLALTLSSFISKRAEEINNTLAVLATHDALTGLPNRLYLTEILSALKEEDNSSNSENHGCLFVIDLDKFKEVNDSFGHSTGDQLLIALSRQILAVVTSPNVLMRIAGDEFVVWAPGYDVEQGKALARSLFVACDTTIPLNGLDINTGASIGFAHYPTHTTSSETLVSCADSAMYKAKRQRSGWEIYDTQIVLSNENDVMLKAELNDAMEKNQLVLHYQPKVDMRTGSIVGVEGLCRWQHPEFGLLMPYAFIDLIEHSGKVQDFGRYIIKQAICCCSSWQKEGINVPIAINLSPYNLLDPGLKSYIEDTLNEFQLPASRIQIELTENETCLNINHIQSALDELRQLGIEVAIDDFGTGMSSLAYLDNLNANSIKIDKTFITDLDTSKGHRAIVSAALTLADSFDCDIIAEGVETKHHAELLISMGCFFGQGYYFAKPMPEDQVKAMIKAGKVLT